MTWPPEPSLSLPRWAYDNSSLKTPPPSDRTQYGWQKANPSVEYGEAPPFQWVNYEDYLRGEWIKYLRDMLNFYTTNPAPFTPSIANLGFSAPVDYDPSEESGLNFDSNSYYNWSGFSVFNNGNQSLAAPFTGYCKIDFSTISQKINSSGQNNTEYRYDLLRDNDVMFTFVGRTASTNPGLDTPRYLTDSFSYGFQINVGQTVSITFANGALPFIFGALPICTITFIRTPGV